MVSFLKHEAVCRPFRKFAALGSDARRLRPGGVYALARITFSPAETALLWETGNTGIPN
jgi:hypothetical protein